MTQCGPCLLTFIIPKTASFQLVFRGFLHLSGFRSHIKSTPQMFPLWFRWLTHYTQEEVKEKKIRIQCKHTYILSVAGLSSISSKTELSCYLVCIFFAVTVLMSSVIWWNKSLWTKKFVNLAALTSIPITIIWMPWSYVNISLWYS